MTKLNKPIQLAGEWLVGLAEIAYPQSWYNVCGLDDPLRWSVYNEGGTEVNTESQDYFLHAGIYSDARTMIDQFWMAMRSGVGRNHGLVVTFNDTTHRITVQVGPRHKVRFNKALAKVLGLTEENTDKELPTGSYMGQEILDLSQDLQSMYVHCDLVEPQVVGDGHAPLLRTVPLTRVLDTPDTTHKVFNHIYFLPVHRNDIHTIEIDIRDDVGRPVPFNRGRLIATLVFKKRLSAAIIPW